MCYKIYSEHQIMNTTRFREICSDDGAELLQIKTKSFSDDIVQFLGEWVIGFNIVYQQFIVMNDSGYQIW